MLRSKKNDSFQEEATTTTVAPKKKEKKSREEKENIKKFKKHPKSAAAFGSKTVHYKTKKGEKTDVPKVRLIDWFQLSTLQNGFPLHFPDSFARFRKKCLLRSTPFFSLLHGN